MLRWYANPNLDVFAAQIQKESARLRSLKEITKPGRNNIASQIAWFLGRQYLEIARGMAPEDTGLLKQSHRVGQPEFSSTTDGIKASVIIDIDPNTIENVRWGGYPVDYGADYHQDRLQWFDHAAAAMDPLIDRLADDMFHAYVERLWDR